MIMLRILKITVASFLLLFLCCKDIVFAQTYSNFIDASLKLSLCGDGVVEGPEDCEIGLDVLKTCLDYGYQEGLLSCEYSCSFDYSNCRYIQKEEEVKEPIVEEVTIDEADSVITESSIKEILNNLPLLLRVFDFNRDGKIDFPELTNLLVDWVENWRVFRQQIDDESKEGVKGACDVNDDSVCNVIDFSIILYHVDND